MLLVNNIIYIYLIFLIDLYNLFTCIILNGIFTLGQSTDSSPKKGPEFSLLSVRRANSCPEIKKTNGSSISSGTSPLQEETEEDHHGDGINISNGHVTSLPVSILKLISII